MKIDIERLKRDAAYWDEVAPDGAEVMIDETYFSKWVDGIEHEFYPNEDTEWKRKTGFTNYSLEKYLEDPDRWHVIPRPEPATEWDGGLPPVGVECEMQMTFTKWESVEVLAHKDGGVVLWRHAKRTALFTENKEILRPILTKAERDREGLERLINRALKECHYSASNEEVSRKIAGNILAAGWKKPE